MEPLKIPLKKTPGILIHPVIAILSGLAHLSSQIRQYQNFKDKIARFDQAHLCDKQF